MTDPSIAENETPRRSRTRRREAMINAIATVLGCMALVVMIATVVRVVMVKLWESARVNPEYVQSVYDSDLDRGWSGNTSSSHALLSGENEPKQPAKTTHPARADTPSAALPQTVGTLSASASAPAAEMKEISTAAPREDAKTVLAAAPVEAAPADSGIKDIESKRLKIESTVRGFFQAVGVGGKLVFARDPQRVRPLMENYYHSHPMEVLEWKNLGWVLPVEEPGFRLGYAQAVFTNAETVSLIIEEMTDGSFRVDWESSVRYGELDWNEFIKTKPAAPTLFRVIASKAQSSQLQDAPQGSEVLEIKHSTGDDVVYAYFDRKDPKFQPLLHQLQSGNWKDVPLTLRLCYPGPAGSGKSVRIADIEGKGWLILHGTRS